jgi:hypothetical protein
VVSLLAMGPMVVGSRLAEDDGFLRVIKICSAQFLWRGSNVVSPIL